VRDVYWLRTSLEAILANDGAKTPGVDGMTKEHLENERPRALLVERVARDLREGCYQPSAVRRVYIPKANGKLRPLGIPTIADRTVQECLRMVLEPIYESHFLPCSYGFRPGRSTMDAIKRLDSLVNQNHFYWVVEGDIEGCFDNIPHKRLLAILAEVIEDRKVLRLIRHMLAAGYVEDGRTHTPNCGTPQGGVVSPLLANVYLHQMDKVWHQQYRASTAYERTLMRKVPGRGTALLIRYADDFLVVTNGNRVQAEAIKDEFTSILDGLQLRLSASKTLVTHVNDGFAFLGFQCQRKPVPQYAGRKYVLYITPTDKNIQRLKTKVEGIFATDYEDVANKIRAVNTVVRGWCNYYRHVASSDARRSLDHWLWQRMMLWLRKKHDRNLTSRELCERYLKSNRKGQQRWSCEGVFLVKPSLDVKFKHYLARKIPHPYLDPMASLTIQVEEPVPDGDVWSGASSQNRYAIDRLRRMKAVNYHCEACQKGPVPIMELDAHHPSGKRDGTWHEIVILCKDCHKQTASFGVKLANRASGEPDALKGASPVRRRGKTHELGD